MVALSLAMVAFGCNQRAWYAGFQESGRQECYRLPVSEARECLERMESLDYDEYQRQRALVEKK